MNKVKEYFFKKLYMITFLIPTYNEYLNIDILVKKIANLSLAIDYNIFFVDDNSNDGSLSKFKELKDKNRNVNYRVRISNSKDLTNSILYALEFINSKYIFVMDCDLQHDINAIPKMISLIENQNFDLVIGSRKINNIQSFKRRYISFIGIWITKLIGIPKLTDPLSGFFVIRTEDFKRVSNQIKTKGYKILLTLIFLLGNNINIKEILINFYPRKYEKSKLNFKVIMLFISQILNLLLLRLIRMFNKI